MQKAKMTQEGKQHVRKEESTDGRPSKGIDEHLKVFITYPIWPFKCYKSGISDCDYNRKQITEQKMKFNQIIAAGVALTQTNALAIRESLVDAVARD